MRKVGVGIACGIAVSLSIAEVGRAEPLVGLTTTNVLIRFDSATPGTVQTIGTVTGLAPGDDLVGIDRRASLGPNNGRLYAIGVNAGDQSGRVYVLDETTAAATLVATLTADPADVTAPFPFTTIVGANFGIDFNPVVDRLRVVSDLDQNLRINVDTGLVQLDGTLDYAGDTNPNVVAAAYDNNAAGAVSTTLRLVEIGLDPNLLIGAPNPNSGAIETLGGLSFDAPTENASYDISGTTGIPYFAVTPTGGTTSLWVAPASDPVGAIGAGLELDGIATGVGPQIVPPDVVVPDCDELPDCLEAQHLPDADEAD